MSDDNTGDKGLYSKLFNRLVLPLTGITFAATASYVGYKCGLHEPFIGNSSMMSNPVMWGLGATASGLFGAMPSVITLALGDSFAQKVSGITQKDSAMGEFEEPDRGGGWHMIM